MGMEKLNPVTLISHSESTIDKEVEFTTSTQYVISGSTSGMSRVKGAVQVRKMSVSAILISGDPTADSRPVNYIINKAIMYYWKTRAGSLGHNVILITSIVSGLLAT